MKKTAKEVKKKRALAMSHEQHVLMGKIKLGLAANEEIRTFSEACRRINVNQSNGRRAVLGHSNGETAQKTKEEILKMAGIKPKQPKAKTTTGELS